MDEGNSGCIGKITAANPKDIADFLGYIEKYPSEIAADFRRFYGISLWDVPTKVSWAEAILLLKQLMNNTESATLTKVNQYSYPFSKTDMLLMDTYDLILAANSEKKQDGYPRPWNAPKKINKGTMPLAKAMEFFSRLGHK